jgi:hypothetical protein
VNDDVVVLDTATLVGGFNDVVAETELESDDSYASLTVRIVIGEYVVA